METVEIRFKRSAIYVGIGFFTFVCVALLAGAAFSAEEDKKWLFILVTLAIYGLAMAAFYPSLKKARRNEPYLIFSPRELSIKDAQEKNFLWIQIIEWTIEEDEGNHYLILRTSEKNERVHISYLEKTPEEIAALIEFYRK